MQIGVFMDASPNFILCHDKLPIFLFTNLILVSTFLEFEEQALLKGVWSS